MAGRKKDYTKRQPAIREEARVELRYKHLLKWDDPDELSQAVSEFYDDCDQRNAPYTVAGLALWLGFSSKDSIRDYCGRKDELGEVMNSARLRIEQQRSEQLITAEGAAPVGKMFDLKCNFGWQEPPQKQEVTNPDGNMGTKVVTVLPEAPPSMEEYQRWYQDMMSQRHTQHAELDGEKSGEAIDADYSESEGSGEAE